MPYAHVDGGVIDGAAEVLPSQARRLDTNELVTDLPAQPVQVQEACGWFLIDQTTNPRPADTTTTTWSSGFVLVAGRPVEQWTEVTKSAKQVEDETRSNKASTIRDTIAAAYARLDQIADYTAPNLQTARLTTISTTNTYANNTTRDAAIRDVAVWAVAFLVEWQKAVNAIQDVAADLKGLARLTLSGVMLDADKD